MSEILQEEYHGVFITTVKVPLEECPSIEEIEKHRKPNGFLKVETDFRNCAFNRTICAHRYFFAERFLEVSVRLRTAPEMTARKRFEVIEQTTDLQTLLAIAVQAFVTDRRFHLRRFYEENLAKTMLHGYLEAAFARGDETLLCLHKNQIAGFALLEKTEAGYSVYLAAVLPQYQGSGAAVDLYRGALEHAKAKQAKVLTGRISSANTAVMNLYARLGASFSNPKDEYFFEEEPV